MKMRMRMRMRLLKLNQRKSSVWCRSRAVRRRRQETARFKDAVTSLAEVAGLEIAHPRDVARKANVEVDCRDEIRDVPRKQHVKLANREVGGSKVVAVKGVADDAIKMS